MRSKHTARPAGTADFESFARREWARLRSTGFWLCGNWHTAEDLAQATLVKVYARWRVLRSPEKAAAYARKVLTRTWIDWQRKTSSGEVPAERLPEEAAQGSGSDLRVTLLAALDALPSVQRAVVVLRYWEDRPVDEVAALLRRKPATVRSDAARGLAVLRQLLSEKVQ